MKLNFSKHIERKKKCFGQKSCEKLERRKSMLYRGKQRAWQHSPL